MEPANIPGSGQAAVATLNVYRPSQYADMLRKYRVEIDGIYVGKIRPGEMLEFEIPAGRAEVLARIDWCSSKGLELDLTEGSTCTVEVGSSLNGWRVLLVLLYITLWTSDYLYARIAPEPV